MLLALIIFGFIELNKMKRTLILISFLIGFSWLTAQENGYTIVNPYDGVTFDSVYKSNLHTHTTESDGVGDPDEN